MANATVCNSFIEVPGTEVKIPMITVSGGEGPRFCITAGIHADEYVHEQAAIELAAELAQGDLAGTVTIVPVSNVPGFERRGTSMVPDDETNLNRVFPGDPEGNLANRIANAIFNQAILGADWYLDCHSGDYYEDLATHCYYLADVECSPACEALAHHTDMHSLVPCFESRRGNTVVSAAVAGVPAVLIERGGMGRWSREEVEAAKADLRNALRFAGILEGEARDYSKAQLSFPGDKMIDEYAPVAGCWYPTKRPDGAFAKGEVLGQIRNVFGEVLHTVVAPDDGMVIFQTGSLNVVEGGPLIAYGLF